MPAVEIILRDASYRALEVPAGCTVDHWRESISRGLLGDRILYPQRLACFRSSTGELLAGAAALPAPPDQMRVEGPSSVAKMLELALSKKLGRAAGLGAWEQACGRGGFSALDLLGEAGPELDPEDPRVALCLRRVTGWPEPALASPGGLRADAGSGPMGQTLSGYLVRGQLGQGLGGAKVYLAERAEEPTRAAVKWPLKRGELEAWMELRRRTKGCPGLAQLLHWGFHAGKPHAVMELLGWEVTRLLGYLERSPLQQRWRAVRVVGRMVLRGLEAMHRCGYVHCDVSPLNILLGRARGSPAMAAAYLIDFGAAQRYPGGVALGPWHGTTEFASARTAAGGARVREDDLEALGWTMAFLLFGGLPWMPWLREDLSGLAPAEYREHRERLRERVRAAKSQLLHEGWGSLGPEWARLREVPEDLDGFMQACRTATTPPEQPDYPLLARLLGQQRGLDSAAAEHEDLRDFQCQVLALVLSHEGAS